MSRDAAIFVVKNPSEKNLALRSVYYAEDENVKECYFSPSKIFSMQFRWARPRNNAVIAVLIELANKPGKTHTGQVVTGE